MKETFFNIVAKDDVKIHLSGVIYWDDDIPDEELEFEYFDFQGFLTPQRRWVNENITISSHFHDKEVVGSEELRERVNEKVVGDYEDNLRAIFEAGDAPAQIDRENYILFINS